MLGDSARFMDYLISDSSRRAWRAERCRGVLRGADLADHIGIVAGAVAWRVRPDAVDHERFAQLVEVDVAAALEKPPSPGPGVIGCGRDREKEPGASQLVGRVGDRCADQDVA